MVDSKQGMYVQRQARKESAQGRGDFCNLKQVVEEGLTKELMSEQRSEGKEGGNCVYISMKCIPGRGDSQCKGPGVGWSWLPMQPCLGL